MDRKLNKKKVGIAFFAALIFFSAGVFIIANPLLANNSHNNMDMDGMRGHFIELKETIIGEQIVKGDYACCLENPCTYCIEKTPKHGEGAKCTCLEDILNGVHPCGECIGEIMEGHGNRFLSKYFARAIAEEVGEEHIVTLRKIMQEKYGLPIEEQL